MAKGKQDAQQLSHTSNAGEDYTKKLSDDVAKNNVGGLLSNPDILSTYLSSRQFRGIFQPVMSTWQALTSVVQGDVDTLLALIMINPDLFFHKGNITGPRGQIYITYRPICSLSFFVMRTC